MDLPETIDLPSEIIDLSLKRLVSPEDVIRCGAVCKLWQAIVAEIRKKQLGFTPWLMLSPPHDHEEKPLFQKFFNFANNKIVNMEIPHTKGRRCWGSPFGWILTVGFDLNIHILNPLSQIQMSLPSLFTLEHQFPVDTPQQCLRTDFIDKLVLSSYPSDSFVQVMAIYGEFGYLAVAKPGDEIWTSVSRPENVTTCSDAIFFKGQFYVVTTLGQLLICDTTHTNSPIATYFCSPPEQSEEYLNKFYLVEMHGDLFMIERNFETVLEEIEGGRSFHHETFEFVAHKLDFNSNSWIYSQTLGDYALFLGNNTSFAISTIEYPNIKRNCIYFTDDHDMLSVYSFCDMGVYDYDQGTVDVNIFEGDDVHTSFARPFFFIPGF